MCSWYQDLSSPNLAHGRESMCGGVGQVAAELDEAELDVQGGLVELPDLAHHVPDMRVEGLVAGCATRQRRQITMSP